MDLAGEEARDLAAEEAWDPGGEGDLDQAGMLPAAARVVDGDGDWEDKIISGEASDILTTFKNSLYEQTDCHSA